MHPLTNTKNKNRVGLVCVEFIKRSQPPLRYFSLKIVLGFLGLVEPVEIVPLEVYSNFSSGLACDAGDF